MYTTLRLLIKLVEELGLEEPDIFPNSSEGNTLDIWWDNNGRYLLTTELRYKSSLEYFFRDRELNTSDLKRFDIKDSLPEQYIEYMKLFKK